jgi:hypothetical protein
MICAATAARPAFRVGVWDRNGRERSEDGADDHISGRGAKSLSFWREEPRRAEGRKEKAQCLCEMGYSRFRPRYELASIGAVS